MEPFICSKQIEDDNASDNFVQDLQILTNTIYKKVFSNFQISKFPKKEIMTKEDQNNLKTKLYVIYVVLNSMRVKK